MATLAGARNIRAALLTYTGPSLGATPAAVDQVPFPVLDYCGGFTRGFSATLDENYFFNSFC